MIFTSTPVGVQSIAISQSVYLSTRVSQKPQNSLYMSPPETAEQ